MRGKYQRKEKRKTIHIFAPIIMLVIILCAAGVWLWGNYSNGNVFSAFGNRQNITNAENAISAIGIITVDSEQQIADAQAAYDLLTEKEKLQVENREVLFSAWSALDEAKKEADRYAQLALFLGEWKNVRDGDTYAFEEGGSGLHDATAVQYSIEESYIYVIEGAGSTQAKKFQLDISGEYSKLIPDGENTFYVPSADYEVVGAQVREESIGCLTSVEFWKNTKGINYVQFQSGGGYFLLSGVTLGLSWEMLDNDTVKLSVDYEGGYTITLDIVNDGGNLKLIDHGSGEVMYIPKT